MNDATLSWQPSPVGIPTGFVVVWTHNAVALPGVAVPFVAGQAEYSVKFSVTTGSPSKPGDTIGATVQAVDSTGKFLSGNAVSSTPPTVTEPLTPLGDPANVVLVLS